MADKRELLLVIKGRDEGAKKALDGVADSAEDAKDDLSNMRKGLDALDAQMGEAKKSAAALRAEINKSGDLGLIKDLQKAESQIKKFERQRKLLLGADDGRESAEEFSLSFAQRIGPLMARAPISPPLIGAAVAAAPLVASVIAGAVTLGLGAGAVAAGLKLAADDPSVEAAAMQVGGEVSIGLRNAAQDFVPEARKAIALLGNEFDSLRPIIEDVFEDSAEYVEPLTRAVAGFVRGLAPGVRDAVANAGPLVDMLAVHIPRVGQVAGDVISDLSTTAEQSADTIAGILAATEASLAVGGKILTLLGGDASKFLGLGPLQALGDITSKGDKETTEWADSLRGLATALGQTGDAAEAAAKAARDYRDANRALTDQNLSVAESTLRYKEAINGARDAVDKKRKVSLAEEGALLSQARASNTLIESLDRQGASAATLAQKHRDARAQLIETATRMGYTRDRAEDLADQYLATPRFVNTVFTADTDQAARNLRRVRDLAAQIRSKRVVITVDVRGRQSVRVGGRNVPIGDLGGVAEGGYIEGPGPKGVDSEPRLLAPGEFVLRSSAVDRIGRPALEAMNSGGGKVRDWMMSAGGRYYGGGTARVTVTTVPGVEHELHRLIMKMIRVEVAGPGSGSVQRTFG